MPHVRFAYGAFIGVIGGAFLGFAALVYRGDEVAAVALAALLAWCGASSVLVALAYFARAPQVLGKRRATGRFPLWARVVWLPYFAVAALVLALIRRRKESPADEVAPGIHVGGIPRDGVPRGVTLVIDLCAEFAAGPRGASAYLAIPTLDGCAPDAADANAAIEHARQHENVLVHCAAGRGRSATIAVLIALDRGLFVDGDEAIRAFRRARPSIAPTSAQRALIARRG